MPAAQKPLTASLTVGQDAGWNLGADGKITFGFSAGVAGSISILKEGDELFKYKPGKDPDTGEDRDDVSVKVPAGLAYVSVNLQLSLGVEGGGSYSGGEVGVKVDLSDKDTFTVINNKCFADPTTVKDAIKSALEDFILPFKAKGVEGLNDGDYIDYEFIGNLAFSVGVTYGVNGLFLGEGTGGELKKTLGTDAAKVVAGVKPSYSFGAEFGIKYEHEDAYRIVSGRQKQDSTNAVSLNVLPRPRRTGRPTSRRPEASARARTSTSRRNWTKPSTTRHRRSPPSCRPKTKPRPSRRSRTRSASRRASWSWTST